MITRSWIALLLLINYLLVVGMGCMSRPEDQHELVRVQTDVNGHYQECRYLRMDGLEDFLNEALASRYQNAPEIPKHHLISIVSGVDAHHLPLLIWPLNLSDYQPLSVPFVGNFAIPSSGLYRISSPPPRLG